MKLHELKPAAGSRKERTRVGRGIAAGQGKTAGRGTKGQKSRAGAGIPAWFEGGQTPIHVRVPKLRGFKRRFKVEYQVVNVGHISEYAAQGRFGVAAEGGKAGSRSAGSEPHTVNADLLASAGLIRSDSKPLKVLGQGAVDQKLFVAADAFTASARRKIEEAGGFVQLLRPEPEPEAAAAADDEAATAPEASVEAQASTQAEASVEPEGAAGAEAQAPEDEPAGASRPRRRTKSQD